MKKRTLLLLLILCLCMLLPTAAFAYEGDNSWIGTGNWSNGYGWWSQAQSTDWLMQKYGCFVVAESKMLVESGVASGDPAVFNPDVMHQWNISHSMYEDYYNNNMNMTSKGFEGPGIYAGEIGKSLYYEGTTWSNIEAKVWENINAGKYSILMTYDVGQHFVLVNNGASQYLGRIRIFESHGNWVPAGTEDLGYSVAAVYTYRLPDNRPAPTTPYTSQSQYSNGSNVTVNWAASSGATSYYINVNRTDPSGSVTSYLSQRYSGGTSYTLTSLPAGTYTVYLQACSDVWSSDPLSCQFTVDSTVPLQITNQPKNRTVSVGGSTNFTVGATGSSLTYMWMYKAYKGGNWQNVENGSGSTYRVTNVTPDMNGWQYCCYVTDGSGESLTSNTVTLTVSSQNEGGFAYAVVDGGATVMGYTGADTQIAIPATLGGYPVTGIANNAFYSCSGLTGVTIPEGVTYIGDYAFYGCSGLTGALTLPSTLTSVGTRAFYGCSGLTGTLTLPAGLTTIKEGGFINCSGLTGALTLPTGLTSLGSRAFVNCSGLTGATIPGSLQTLYHTVFSGCSGLTSVTISEGITIIRDSAFNNCTSLRSITLPVSLTRIQGAFYRCSSLADVWYAGTQAQWNKISIENYSYMAYNTPLLNATLHFVVPPEITMQPTDQAVTEGQTATFAVEASGTEPVSYQWFVKKTADGEWREISAASSKTACYTLTTASRHNGYQYKCHVTTAGGDIWSDVVTLTVSAAGPTITAQPKSVSVPAGQTASFTVAATGGTLSYQWEYRTSADGAWVAVSAASGKTESYSLTVKARHDGYQYRCAISDGATKVYSATATLSVDVVAALTITTQPKSVTVAAGQTASFTVAATGGAGALSYQWEYRTPADGSWTAVTASSGKTESYSLTAKARHNGYQYRCAVSGDGASAYSDIVTLTVTTAPSILFTAQPANVAVSAGETAYFIVEANGSGALSYQWEYRTSAGGSWTAVSAASGKTDCYSLTAKARHNGYQYRCAVSDGTTTVYSNVAALYVR